MLTPYPLEPPPPLPPLDEPWEGPPLPPRSGRRARVGPDREVRFPGGVLLHPEGLRPADRWVVALEEPCVVWEREGSGPVELRWRIALGPGVGHLEAAADGTTAWLTREGAPAELLLGCRGGALSLHEGPAGIQCLARGEGRVRLIVIGAEDESDRDRILRALARKGLSGLLAQRRQHAERLDGYGAALQTPDRDRDAAFAAAKHDYDAAVEELAGGRRTLSDPLGQGTALLACGLREQVRDVLRGPFHSPELLRLVREYARWAGADEFLQKQWARACVEVEAAGDRSVAAGLLPVAEALGDHAALAALDVFAAGAAPPPRAPLPPDLEALWGIVPDALDRSLLLRPELPVAWREMTLQRLRVGPTTLAVRAERRPGAFVLRLSVAHGPALTVRLAPRLWFRPTGVLVQDEPLGGPEATFVLEREGEARWME